MANTPQQQRLYCAHPCFMVTDVVASAEFYRDKLGFSFHRYGGEPPCFVMVARDNVEVFLSYTGPGLAKPNHRTNPDVSWDAYVRASDADALCAEFKSRGVKIHHGLETTFYGQREFVIEDPDGDHICFAHNVTPLDLKPA